ncbi:methyl-accepting chemotaxis protein [Stutzerimonas kunmingensis]|uniref:methyl-accepting chemotaxis protein n=1 Tax=Stutzerimonas kunmingensis TaxID=1211807 RepID=UPI0028A76773|nr:methyl-accepting chemotaxis protein [Stutzerimonas kunmingensis]
MKTFLHPGIALMNRLSFAMKFTLISVLFFVPLLVANFFLVADSSRQWKEASAVLRSLDLVSTTLQLQKDLGELRDLSLIRINVSQADQNSDVLQRISAKENSALANIQSMTLADGTAEEIQTFKAKRDELLDLLGRLMEADGLAPKKELAGQMATRGQLFLLFVVNQSGLRKDQYLAVRQLAELVSTVTPSVTRLLGTARAVSSYSLGQGFLNADNNIQLDATLTQLQELQGEYALNIEEILNTGAHAKMQLSEPGQVSLESLEKVSRLIEDSVLNTTEFSTPWPEFFDRVTALVDTSYRLNDASISLLSEQLDERVASTSRQTLMLIVALIVIFVLIAYLYGSFYVSTLSVLDALGTAMNKAATGDMTVNFTTSNRDELGRLGGVFNGTIKQIHDLIQRVDGVVGEVGHQADQVQEISSQSSTAATEQRSQIEQVAAAINQLSATAQEVARSAAMAASSAQSANQETINGRTLIGDQINGIQSLASEIDRSMQAINKLAADSASIGQVLDVIKGIAEQTNLLALNAAIEAARAGEQGRGFAVVADEVRNLAKRTQQSTTEIERMISSLHSGVQATVKTMSESHLIANSTVGQSDKVQRALDNILDAVGMIADQNEQIATAAEQQTAVAQDIDQNITQISHAGERTADGAERTEESSRQLLSLVTRLKHEISAFRT